MLIKCLYEMHGATIKTVNAQQAKLNTNYKNTKLKLLKVGVLIKCLDWMFLDGAPTGQWLGKCEMLDKTFYNPCSKLLRTDELPLPNTTAVAVFLLWQQNGQPCIFLLTLSGVPRNLVRGSFNRENRDLGGGSPLVRGAGGSCNLVQEISFHIVKFS